MPRYGHALYAMLRAYFDTNVFDHIDKGDVPAKDVEDIRAALASGKLIAHISLADIEELLGDWDKNRTAAIRRLQVARNLIGFKSILKQPSDLLKEAIEAYAVGKTQPSPTLPREQRRVVDASLNRIANGSAKLDSVVTQIVADVRAQKETFRTTMGQRVAKALGELNLQYSQRDLSRVPFELFLEDAPQWAESLASRVGLDDACRQRGLHGLLEVRMIRLCVVAAKSLVYSQVVEGCQPQRGDGYDLWHAILASVADVFVTFDGRLAGNLVRVPVDGFRVATSLQELADLF